MKSKNKKKPKKIRKKKPNNIISAYICLLFLKSYSQKVLFLILHIVH